MIIITMFTQGNLFNTQCSATKEGPASKNYDKNKMSWQRSIAIWYTLLKFQTINQIVLHKLIFSCPKKNYFSLYVKGMSESNWRRLLGSSLFAWGPWSWKAFLSASVRTGAWAFGETTSWSKGNKRSRSIASIKNWTISLLPWEVIAPYWIKRSTV